MTGLHPPHPRASLAVFLRPTGWLALGLLVFWFWRVLSLLALGKWGHDVNAGDVAAFAWDVLLCAGVFGVARVADTFVARGPLAVRVLVRVLASLLVLTAFVTRAADVAYGALTGGHWSSVGFLYVSAQNVGLLHDGDGPLLVASLLGASVLAVAALYMDLRALRKRATLPPMAARRSGLIPSVLPVVLILLPLVVGFSAIEEDTHRFVPEAVFLHEWIVWRGWLDDESADDLLLNPALRARFVKLGLAPQTPLYPGYPISTATLDTTPFPHPKTPAAALGRPNVVLTLVEQLNHEFMYSFSHELRGVMPQLSKLSERMTMVTEYQSTTTPTIHALVSSLCSVHSAAPDREVKPGQGSEALVHTPFECLQKILKDQGYRTLFIQGGKKEFAFKADFLTAHGFDEVHGRPELEARYPGSHISRWGMHDDALVDYTQEQIQRLEALRAKDGRPYFVMMLTLDTHSPGLPPPQCKAPAELTKISRDADSRLMIRSLYCSDAALARLGRFILDDPSRSQRTVWALTGDHPTSAMKFVRDLHEKHDRSYTGWSGRLPLLLYDPTHALPRRVPVLSSHIDLAPTLLHLLDVQRVPNAMTGFSIFGKRPALPMLVGRVGPKWIALFRPGQTRSMSMGQLDALCKARKPIFKGDRLALDACELRAWVRWQDSMWKEKKLFPAK